MPTGSDGIIGHGLSCSQICAQDPNSWTEATAPRRLRWISSARLRRWNVLVQSYHWWWELGLRLRSWDKVTILPLEKPHVTKAKNARRWNNFQQHYYHFLWYQGIVHKEFVPKSQTEFRVILRSFAATARKRAKTSPQSLVRTDLSASPWQRRISHCHPYPPVSDDKQICCYSPPTILPWFGNLRLLPISKT